MKMYDIQIFQPHGENELGNGASELNAPNSPREGLKKKRKVDSASQGVEVPILKNLFNYHNTIFWFEIYIPQFCWVNMNVLLTPKFSLTI